MYQLQDVSAFFVLGTGPPQFWDFPESCKIMVLHCTTRQEYLETGKYGYKPLADV